jgi:hypothetical protein
MNNVVDILYSMASDFVCRFIPSLKYGLIAIKVDRSLMTVDRFEIEPLVVEENLIDPKSV